MIQINDYELGSTLMPFEKWESGVELYERVDKDEGILDRDVRRWAEECDQMQGFQVYAGADDAWGGFASKYLEDLRDEYGKVGIWLWGLEEPVGRGSRVGEVLHSILIVAYKSLQAQLMLRTLNVSRTVSETHEQASLYIPFSLPIDRLPQYINLDEGSSWHTAALLSAVVETMTLPTRLREGRSRRGYLNDMDASLNVNGNQHIAACQCSVVDPQAWEPNGTPLTGAASDARIPTVDDSRRSLDREDVHDVASRFDMDFLPGSSSDTGQEPARGHTFARVESLRGYLEEPDPLEIEDIGETRQRRRLESLPIMEKLVPLHAPPD